MDDNGYLEYVGFTGERPDMRQRSPEEIRRLMGKDLALGFKGRNKPEDYELAQFSPHVIHKNTVGFIDGADKYLVKITMTYVKL
jgi:hypothetical protein